MFRRSTLDFVYDIGVHFRLEFSNDAGEFPTAKLQHVIKVQQTFVDGIGFSFSLCYFAI